MGNKYPVIHTHYKLNYIDPCNKNKLKMLV